MDKTEKTIAAFIAYTLIVMLTQNVLLLIDPWLGMIYAFMSNNWLDFYSITEQRFPIILIYNYVLLFGLFFTLFKIYRHK